jgi:steroid delta-isomerase-like uncharacterized protein
MSDTKLFGILATVAGVLFLGCNAEAQVHTKLFEDFLAGWSNNMAQLLPLFTDDIVYEDAAMGVVTHGKDELRAFAQSFFSTFPDIQFTLTSTLVTGNRAAIEWTGMGTHKGDMPGMPATNKRATFRGVSIMELQDGKIKRNTDYWDLATLMKQLGFIAER